MPAMPAVAAAGSQIRYRVAQQQQQQPSGGGGGGALALSSSSPAGGAMPPPPSSSSSSSSPPPPRAPVGSAAAGGLDFVTKLKMAWRIFFPERPAAVSPKEEGKQRLRMILVADRCGMSPAGLTDLKRTILRALGEYVDIDVDSEEQIDVSVTVEPGLGTIYCVAVPVARVRPAARVRLADGGTLAGMTVVGAGREAAGGVGGEGGGGGAAAEGGRVRGAAAAGREGGGAARRRGGADGGAGEGYNPEDWDSDPSSQFPYGC